MILPTLCSIVCVAISAAALSAQIPDSVFKGAWRWGPDTIFSFDSPIPFDLSVIAQSARPEFQPAHPDTSLIREFYDEDHGATWIPYEAPLPPFLPARHYWVLGDSGATEVYPRTVSGTIYIETDTAGWPVNRVLYFGSLKAPRPTGKHVGAPSFGFFSPTPVRVRSAPATVGGTDRRPTIRSYLRPRRIVVTLDSLGTIRSGGLPSRARAFQILETGQAFLSVRWPDDDICKGESVLYDISTGVPRFVALSPGPCGE